MSSRVKQKQANRIVRETLAREKRRQRTMIVSIVAVVAVVLAGVVGFGLYELQKPNSYHTPAHANSDGTGIVVSNGPVRVDLYVDYLCPHCKEFEDSAEATLDQMVKAKKIELIYHPIAILDQDTNPTGYSSRAGSAAGCAADGGKFLEFTKAAYSKQPAEGSAGLTDDQLIQIGAGVGLINPTFAQCVRAGMYVGWMAHNTDAAGNNNVSGTPTLMVNGKTVDATLTGLNAAVNGASD